MYTFRITSQRISNGNKAMGGLRGSSKVGTSGSNRRAQSRRAYGGVNFSFNVNPSPDPSPAPAPAPEGVKLDGGKFLVTWDSTSTENSNVASLPSTIQVSDATGSSFNESVIQYSINSQGVTLTWDSTLQHYKGEGPYTGETPIEIDMEITPNTDYAAGSVYNIIYDGQINGSVVPLPSGEPIDDRFYLYSEDSDTSKNYVYFNNTVTDGVSQLVLGEPQGADASDFTKAEFMIKYNELGIYYSGTMIPAKYFSIVNSSEINFSTFIPDATGATSAYASVDYGSLSSDLTASDLDPSQAADGARAAYDTILFYFTFMTSDGSSEEAGIYKEKISPDTNNLIHNLL